MGVNLPNSSLENSFFFSLGGGGVGGDGVGLETAWATTGGCGEVGGCGGEGLGGGGLLAGGLFDGEGLLLSRSESHLRKSIAGYA